MNVGPDKYFIFAGMHAIDGTNYCILRIGQKNEANMNQMAEWESLDMIKWFDDVEMKPR
jgi:hypothetical protein